MNIIGLEYSGPLLVYPSTFYHLFRELQSQNKFREIQGFMRKKKDHDCLQLLQRYSGRGSYSEVLQIHLSEPNGR